MIKRYAALILVLILAVAPVSARAGLWTDILLSQANDRAGRAKAENARLVEEAVQARQTIAGLRWQVQQLRAENTRLRQRLDANVLANEPKIGPSGVPLR
jgi:hypothetical protein